MHIENELHDIKLVGLHWHRRRSEQMKSILIAEMNSIYISTVRIPRSHSTSDFNANELSQQ